MVTCFLLVLYSNWWSLWFYFLFSCTGVCVSVLPIQTSSVIPLHHSLFSSFLSFNSSPLFTSLLSPISYFSQPFIIFFSFVSFPSFPPLLVLLFSSPLSLLLHLLLCPLSSSLVLLVVLLCDSPLCLCDVTSCVMIFYSASVTMVMVLTVSMMMTCVCDLLLWRLPPPCVYSVENFNKQQTRLILSVSEDEWRSESMNEWTNMNKQTNRLTWIKKWVLKPRNWSMEEWMDE